MLEGLMAIPNENFSDIIQFITDAYKKFKLVNKDYIKKNKIAPKIFNLNLTGTKYEFLNEYNPKVKVFVKYKPSLANNGYFWEYDEELKDNTIDDHGNIYINVANPINKILITTLEHELLHYIQKLLTRKTKKEIDYAGLPSTYRKGNLDSMGYRKDGSSKKRVSHFKRPNEFFPNLLSALRTLQSKYYTVLDVKNQEDTEKNRKRYFNFRLDLIQNEKDGADDFEELVISLRGYDKSLYKIFLKNIYKAFVNNEEPFDYYKNVRNAIDNYYDYNL